MADNGHLCGFIETSFSHCESQDKTNIQKSQFYARTKAHFEKGACFVRGI